MYGLLLEGVPLSAAPWDGAKGIFPWGSASISPPEEDVHQGSHPASSNAEEVHGDDGEADGIHEEDHCPALVPGGWASGASLLDSLPPCNWDDRSGGRADSTPSSPAIVGWLVRLWRTGRFLFGIFGGAKFHMLFLQIGKNTSHHVFCGFLGWQ